MNKGILVIAVCIMELVVSCNGQTESNEFKENRKLADTVVKDIPLNKKGRPSSYYQNKSNVENKLGLKSLENGFDSLQIRLWYGYAFKDSSQLVVLRNSNGKWTSELFTLVYHLNENGDALKSISKEIITRDPKSGWGNFIDKVLKLQITTLPDMNKIKDYPDFADGDDIIIEAAAKKYYRIYSYKEPNQVQFKIKEAKNIERILELIENEFDFKRLRKL